MRRAIVGLILLAAIATVVVVQNQAALPARSLSELSAELDRIAASIAEIDATLEAAAPADRALFALQRQRRWTEHHDVLERIVEELQEDSVAAVDEPQIRTNARDALQIEVFEIGGLLAQAAWELTEFRLAAADLPPQDLVEAQIQLSRRRADYDAFLVRLMEDYQFAPDLGIDLVRERVSLEAEIVERAKLGGAALELTLEDRSNLRDWITKPGVDTVSVGLRLAAAEERILGLTTSLRVQVDLMSQAGFEVAEYQRLIVTATGEIGTGVLNTRVLGGLLTQWGDSVFEFVAVNIGTLATRLGVILVIFLVARRLAHLMGLGASRFLSSRYVEVSSLIKNLVVVGASRVVWFVAALLVLSALGIDLGPMLAGIGILGVVIGLALQDTLSNFASGLMIMIYRPFDVGDFITAGGVTGEVKDLTMVSTVVQALDNTRIIVPNGMVWGNVINNATAERIRRVDLVFGISYGDDVDQARDILEDVLSHDDRVLEHPEFMVRVHNLGESSVDLICRPWCKTEDYWDLFWDLTRAVKKRFDAEGITFPFPQREVHVFNAEGGSGAAAGSAVDLSGVPSEG